MKKKLLSLLILIFFCFNSCSGHFASPPAVADREPTPVETLLCCAPWTDGSAPEQRLQFCADGTGSMGAAPFSWAADREEITLCFYPGCLAGRVLTLRMDAADAALCLRAGACRYTPAFHPAAPAETPAPAPDPLEQLGREIADYALGFLGWNYKYGGKSPDTGFDCSGLVYYVYEQFGYRLERVAKDQAKQGIAVEPDALMPGDLLAFHTSGSYVGHIGIYVGGGYYIHAVGAAYGVCLTSLSNPDLQRSFDARRIVGCEELRLDLSAPLPASSPSLSPSPAAQVSPSPAA